MTAKPSQIIPPDAYPQMVSKAQAAQLLGALRGRPVAARAAKAIAAASFGLRDVVRGYVEALERGSGDPAIVYDMVHEIRGLAETAGLGATGRIAESLCRYLDQLEVTTRTPDAAVVMLHIHAISCASRAEDEKTRTSDAVASELASLVTRKLSEIKE